MNSVLQSGGRVRLESRLIVCMSFPIGLLRSRTDMFFLAWTTSRRELTASTEICVCYYLRAGYVIGIIAS